MARKNNRMKTEYHRGLGFDPRKYISAPALRPTHREPDRTPQRGDIWFANLGTHPNSSVQSGTRPVIIISNDIGNSHADTVNVIPMTRHLKKPELPCHTQLDPHSVIGGSQLLAPSMVLAEQLTTISKYALRTFAGHISDDVAMNRIETAVLSQFALERSTTECL
ncbi:MAG: type II toxin-antitoxin system PemK/MazF family toxin [Oscillospiraceae bacterium]|nr:type II toxin-antitoxin system PemK/MazF family toxin [Oscillospiraceae bacterium]